MNKVEQFGRFLNVNVIATISCDVYLAAKYHLQSLCCFKRNDALCIVNYGFGTWPYIDILEKKDNVAINVRTHVFFMVEMLNLDVGTDLADLMLLHPMSSIVAYPLRKCSACLRTSLYSGSSLL
ncbi:hypothetical protein L6452_01227 [Arctium lappa]|uniref:Uncharacterized protein n=1 Tax=Arctium lappa TaxID=4217 RepID=A0ACB9FGI2_ARCLA|nr:hypothetical protein L6452_01227 [Arctium lappa]